MSDENKETPPNIEVKEAVEEPVPEIN